jgi:hypothetical protein
MKRTSSAVLALAFLLLNASTKAQQDATPAAGPDDGVVNAAALRPVPVEASLTVRPWDDSPDNLKVAREIEDQLRQRGRALTTNPQLVLSFSVDDQPGQWSGGSRRQMFEIYGSRGSSSEEDRVRGQLNLYSTEKGGVFNEGRPVETQRSVYTLEMTLDTRDGQRLWQGEATAPLGRSDATQLVKMMIPPLLDALGRTVRNQPFGVK